MLETDYSYRGLSGKHDCVVGLAHFAVEYALEESAAVTEGDEHKRFSLAAKAVNPSENLNRNHR